MICKEEQGSLHWRFNRYINTNSYEYSFDFSNSDSLLTPVIQHTYSCRKTNKILYYVIYWIFKGLQSQPVTEHLVNERLEERMLSSDILRITDPLHSTRTRARVRNDMNIYKMKMLSHFEWNICCSSYLWHIPQTIVPKMHIELFESTPTDSKGTESCTYLWIECVSIQINDRQVLLPWGEKKKNNAFKHTWTSPWWPVGILKQRLGLVLLFSQHHGDLKQNIKITLQGLEKHFKKGKSPQTTTHDCTHIHIHTHTHRVTATK